MKLFYYFILFLGVTVLIINITNLNFRDLNWDENSNKYLGIIGPLFLISAMALLIRHTNKKKSSVENPGENL